MYIERKELDEALKVLKVNGCERFAEELEGECQLVDSYGGHLYCGNNYIAQCRWMIEDIEMILRDNEYPLSKENTSAILNKLNVNRLEDGMVEEGWMHINNAFWLAEIAGDLKK